MTEKLYYKNSFTRVFWAKVASCVPVGAGYDVVLDRTAFFPEGGGQPADTGFIGSARVTHVREAGEEVLHRADRPVPEGARLRCALDWEPRFRRMQEHTGEHIVSGIVHRLFGYANVGFHMDERSVAADFDGELSPEAVTRVEAEANAAVWADVPVRTWFPDAAALSRLDYRSKLDLTENVRLVSVEGVDLCACCATHVRRTGQVGVIKILDHMRHRGGTRLMLAAGADALWDYDRRFQNIREISEALSAPQLETAAAVRRVLGELETARGESAAARAAHIAERAAALAETDGSLCLFEETADMAALRTLVNAGMKKSRVCAAFSGTPGDYKYVIGSERVDLRAAARGINAAIGGQGGGSPAMIQGSAAASREEIARYFRETVFR